MTKTQTPTRSTRRRSVTVAHEEIHEAVERVNIAAGRQPYMLESHAFAAELHTRRRAAAKLHDDLSDEIAELEVELQARLARRSEAASIIAQCDAALAVGPTILPTTAPQIEQHKE